MVGSGIRRKVDDLGRIVIPSSMRKLLGIAEGDLIEIHLDGDRVVLSLPHEDCTFCGSTLNLETFHGKVVCWSCTAALRAKDRRRTEVESPHGLTPHRSQPKDHQLNPPGAQLQLHTTPSPTSGG